MTEKFLARNGGSRKREKINLKNRHFLLQFHVKDAKNQLLLIEYNQNQLKCQEILQIIEIPRITGVLIFYIFYVKSIYQWIA